MPDLGYQSQPGYTGGNYFTKNGVQYDMNAGEGQAINPQGPMGVQGASLSDPNSTASNNLYYGGSAGAASQGMADDRLAGLAAQNRAAPTWDTSQTNQSRGMAAGLGNQLTTLANGDPNSIQQQQLARGYAAARGQLASSVASTRGGPEAIAAARRQGGNESAALGQQQSVASQELMAQQQMGAYGQLAGLGSTMRQADQGAAFGQANQAMQSRGINDAEQARQEGFRQQTGAAQMQGQQNRQNNLQNWNGMMDGADISAERINQQNAFNTQNAVARGAMDATRAAGGLAASFETPNQPDDGGPKNPSDWDN